MGRFVKGDVVVVPFPFSDLTGVPFAHFALSGLPSSIPEGYLTRVQIK